MARKGNIALSVTLLRGQIEFLDSLIKKCRASDGMKLSRRCILRSLIKIMKEFDLDGARIKDEDEMVDFLLSCIVKARPVKNNK